MSEGVQPAALPLGAAVAHHKQRQPQLHVQRVARGGVLRVAQRVPYCRGGTPVVAARVAGCVAPTVSESCGGAAAALVDPANAQEIAEAMKLVEGDETTRNRAIEAGLMRAKEFSWDASAQQLMASIEKVIAAHA